MPLPTPKIFKLLEFWRLPDSYLFSFFVMRTLIGQFKEGPAGIRFFVIKLIWSRCEPMNKLSMVMMCLTAIILAPPELH